MEDGVDLMLCLNPLVPFDATVPQFAKVMQRGLSAQRRAIPRIVDGGLPAVLSQTFRSMIHSRMELGMKHYEHAYPNTDIILIEPDHRDPELYLANTFSYAQRRRLAELARHGISLNHESLNDPKRHLTQPLPAPTRVGQAIGRLQEVMDDLGHVVSSSRRQAVRPSSAIT